MSWREGLQKWELKTSEDFGEIRVAWGVIANKEQACLCLSSLGFLLCVPLSFDTPAKCNTSPSLANVTNSSLKILIQAQYDSRGQQTAQSLFVLLQTLMQYDTLSSIQVERKRAERREWYWIPLEVQLIFNGYTVCLSLHLSPETKEGNERFSEKEERRGEWIGEERKKWGGWYRKEMESVSTLRHECKGNGSQAGLFVYTAVLRTQEAFTVCINRCIDR